MPLIQRFNLILVIGIDIFSKMLTIMTIKFVFILTSIVRLSISDDMSFEVKHVEEKDIIMEEYNSDISSCLKLCKNTPTCKTIAMPAEPDVFLMGQCLLLRTNGRKGKTKTCGRTLSVLVQVYNTWGHP